MPSSHLILCRPLLLLPPIPPSIRVFSNESTLRVRWPEYWSFSFSIIPSKEHLGLISFKMDWLDLLAVQGTLKSLLQHHTSKASILLRSAFFTVQLSHPYMTTGKTIALTRRTFVGKVMSLLFICYLGWGYINERSIVLIGNRITRERWPFKRPSTRREKEQKNGALKYMKNKLWKEMFKNAQGCWSSGDIGSKCVYRNFLSMQEQFLWIFGC